MLPAASPLPRPAHAFGHLRPWIGTDVFSYVSPFSGVWQSTIATTPGWLVIVSQFLQFRAERNAPFEVLVNPFLVPIVHLFWSTPMLPLVPRCLS